MTTAEEAVEAERIRKTKEKHLKHLVKISKNLPKIRGRRLTEDEEEHAKTKRVIAGKPAKEIPLVEAATEAIMSMHKFITIEESQEILYYDNGVYVSGAEVVIEKHAEKLYDYTLANKHLAEIKGHIMRKTYHKREEIDADINIINLKNGLYDIHEDKLTEHTPKYLSINQKPIIYNKCAMPKLFGKFLIQVLYTKDVKTAIDAMAYTFYRDYIVELIFVLYGLGANGKTVFTSLLTSLHGTRNVSNVPLPAMLNNRFALADLESKDVNIDSELPYTTIKETSILKKLTSGSKQPIRIERKNQRAYDAGLYAKLFFNANRIPDSLDMSDAYNRRMIIITFPNLFDGKNADPHLLSKLTTEEELSGIFNVCMNALRRIIVNKGLYINEKTIEERRIKYERNVNPVKAFLEEAIAEDSTADAEISKKDLYDAYDRFCKKYSLPTEKYDHFCKILKSDFGMREKRVEVGIIEGKRQREIWWQGMVLTVDYAPKNPQKRLD